MTPSTDERSARLTDLETRVRDAWGEYRENLTDLDGVAYDEAEKAEWGHLQDELHLIATERSAVRAAFEAHVEAA